MLFAIIAFLIVVALAAGMVAVRRHCINAARALYRWE
jgi:hypothetical protein